MRRRLGLSLAMMPRRGASGLQAQSTQAVPLRTEYVMLVISHGVRWPELYRGASAPLMGRSGHLSDTAELRRDAQRSFRSCGAR